MATQSANARINSAERVMVTPEGIAIPVMLASRGARAGALILDLMIVSALQVALTLFLVFLLFGTLNALPKLANPIDGLGTVEFIVVLWIIAMFLFRYAYFLYFELGPRGATWGKRMAGIRIASRDGGRLTAEMVIARNLLRDMELFMPFAILGQATSGESGVAGLLAAAWFLIFVFFLFYNRDRLRAGDIVAGTWVIEAPKRKLEAAMSASGAAPRVVTAPAQSYRFSDEDLAVYGEFELQSLERVLRDGRPDAVAAVYEAICRKIGWEAGSGDERVFLEAYYTQLRARLEANMRMGQRKADKFS